MTTTLHQRLTMICGAAVLLGLTACASNKTPATADVAVSRAAVANATAAGAANHRQSLV